MLRSLNSCRLVRGIPMSSLTLHADIDKQQKPLLPGSAVLSLRWAAVVARQLVPGHKLLQAKLNGAAQLRHAEQSACRRKAADGTHTALLRTVIAAACVMLSNRLSRYRPPPCKQPAWQKQHITHHASHMASSADKPKHDWQLPGAVPLRNGYYCRYMHPAAGLCTNLMRNTADCQLDMHTCLAELP
jgi:hypothetical protein